VNPSSKAIREFLIHQGELWNDSQRDAMMALYRDIAPNGLQMELPVGAPAQRGWESMEMLWDNYQSTTRVSYPVIAVADNGEAAALERIDPVESGGEPHFSIHSYVFRDGELLVRYFAQSPTPNPAALATRDFLVEQSNLWNAGDREGFFQTYERFTPAGFDIEFPIGAPPNPGQQMLEQLWQGYQADVKLRYRHLFVTDSNEAAISVGNERLVDGQISVNNSLEFYSFDDAGMHVRYFHEGHG
jgi:hypothetical protein